MKKIFIIFAAVCCMFFASCNVHTTVSEGQGCIGTWKGITFYNGGTAIAGPYNNVTVKCRITTNTKMIGNDISFYMYDIYDINGTRLASVMDSEALSCVITY